MALVNVVRASRGTKVDLTWAMASAAWPAVVQASHRIWPKLGGPAAQSRHQTS